MTESVRQLSQAIRKYGFVILIFFLAGLIRFAGVGDRLPYINGHPEESLILTHGLEQIETGIRLPSTLDRPSPPIYTFAFGVSPAVIKLIGQEEIARRRFRRLNGANGGRILIIRLEWCGTRRNGQEEKRPPDQA